MQALLASLTSLGERFLNFFLAYFNIRFSSSGFVLLFDKTHRWSRNMVQISLYLVTNSIYSQSAIPCRRYFQKINLPSFYLLKQLKISYRQAKPKFEPIFEQKNIFKVGIYFRLVRFSVCLLESLEKKCVTYSVFNPNSY